MRFASLAFQELIAKDDKMSINNLFSMITIAE